MSDQTFFWEGLLRETEGGPALVGHKCTRCGQIFFPKTEICFNCLNEEFEPVALSKEGTLYAYTVTRVPIVKFQPPHHLGMITLEDDRLRIFAPLADEVHGVGQRVELYEDVYWREDGRDVWGYKFRAVKE